MTDPVLRFEQVDRSYGKQRSVAAVDLGVAAGEWVSLIGPPGSGKSTLVRLAAGLERPDRGRVTLGGAPVLAGSRARLSTIGAVLDEDDLDHFETVRANLRFRARLQGMKRSTFEARMHAVLGALDIADRERDRLRDLSRLDLCRAAIAAAAIHRPRLIVLGLLGADLGGPARRELLDSVSRLKSAENIAVLWPTTRYADAEAADRIAVLDQGILRFDGPPAGLTASTGAGDVEGAINQLLRGAAGPQLSGTA